MLHRKAFIHSANIFWTSTMYQELFQGLGDMWVTKKDPCPLCREAKINQINKWPSILEGKYYDKKENKTKDGEDQLWTGQGRQAALRKEGLKGGRQLAKLWSSRSRRHQSQRLCGDAPPGFSLESGFQVSPTIWVFYYPTGQPDRDQDHPGG